MKGTLEERFWDKVDKRRADDCWLWLGFTNGAGYGMIRVGKISRAAYRVSWEIANEPIPEGRIILHSCGNPLCVNPSHLFIKARMTTEEKFWRDVAFLGAGGDDCWEWRGDKRGYYGQIGVHGKTIKTHRLSWELANGPIPGGMNVLHHCDNPICVNPKHLFLGTQADNVHDMQAKGRKADLHGEHNGRARLTEQGVHKIREMIKRGITQVAIAKEYNVTSREINNINTGVSWGWLK